LRKHREATQNFLIEFHINFLISLRKLKKKLKYACHTLNYYRKAALNLKRALWGDKPKGLLPENCPIFFLFFCLGRVYEFLISLRKLQFSLPLGLVIIKITRPKQKKKKNWDNFLGANLQVCHPKGPFLNLGRPCPLAQSTSVNLNYLQQKIFPEKTTARESFSGPLGIVIIKITRPKQKKKKKLGQFSGSKPSGLSPQRALFKFREALPFGTEYVRKFKLSPTKNFP
jgi:hypothetical protein